MKSSNIKLKSVSAQIEISCLEPQKIVFSLFHYGFEAFSVLALTQEFLIPFWNAPFTRITLSCHRPTYGVPISQCAKI